MHPSVPSVYTWLLYTRTWYEFSLECVSGQVHTYVVVCTFYPEEYFRDDFVEITVTIDKSVGG